MKKLFVLAFATTFSALYCGQVEIAWDHMGRMQHRLLTPTDGAWYIIRTMKQNNLQKTYAMLDALPEDQRVPREIDVSILVGFRYVKARLPIASYFDWIVQIKEIQLTPEQRHAFELILDPNKASAKNNNLSTAR